MARNPMDRSQPREAMGGRVDQNRTARAQDRDAGSQAMVAASADGIVAVDRRGIIQFCNPAAEALFARSTDDLLGSPFGFPVVSNETSEIDLVLPDGSSRVVEMRVTATTWEGERLDVASLRDVTRRTRAERTLHAELEHQNVVVGMAAHELRNPVAAIKVLVHRLRDQRPLLSEEEIAQIIDDLVDRADRLQMLMRKLLTASRIDAQATLTATKPAPVLELLLEWLADFDDKGQEVRLSCSPELMALVDRDEFSEMLTNYVDNALAYGSPPFEVRATAQGDDWVEIRVCDHGPGVPEVFVPHLFERFSREPHTRREAEGTGLGLWIVRSLSQANGGDAWYEPNDNGGACFCVRLQQHSRLNSPGPDPPPRRRQ